MRAWTAQRIAAAAHAGLVSPGPEHGPQEVAIDSRQAGSAVLFVGLPGTRTDGGKFAAQALSAGAWGVLVGPAHADAAEAAASDQAVLVAADPLKSLQDLATAWRRELGAQVIGVTGSTGKTSTKDLLLGLLSPHRPTVASRANFNTEIGLPLEILSAPLGTEVLVLEMAMRGPGQIAELAGVAEPNVGVIVNVGPVHLELLGSLEAVAAAKAELIAGLAASGTAIVPAAEPLLEPHLRPELRTVRFGEGGDVQLVPGADDGTVQIEIAGELIRLEVSFAQAHLRTNLLAAVAAAWAVGVTPSGRLELAVSPGRGQQIRLQGGVTLIDDSYNANPMSMRAALDALAATAQREQAARRVAVLGDMLELGPQEGEFHASVGEHAGARGVDLLIAVGARSAAMLERFDGESHWVPDAAQAAELVPGLLNPGDLVLVKASRGVGLDMVCGALSAEREQALPGAGR